MNKPFVITVSGSRSGVGKTVLIEMLLPYLPCAAVLKVRAHEGCDFEVLEESRSDPDTGKDTARFIAAGADAAWLITGSDGRVRAAVDSILESGRFEVVLIESNRLALELESDLSFFVDGKGPAKAGAAECRARADVLVSGFLPGKEEQA